MKKEFLSHYIYSLSVIVGFLAIELKLIVSYIPVIKVQFNDFVFIYRNHILPRYKFQSKMPLSPLVFH